MDVLTDVLNTLRLKSSLYCRSALSRPWGLRFVQHTTAVFHAIHGDTCYLMLEDTPTPIQLAAGDIILLPYGTTHVIADEPTSPLYPDTRMEYDAYRACQLLVPRDGTESTTLLCGTFHFENAESHPLLTLLPAMIHIHADNGQSPHGMQATLTHMDAEATANRPGGDLLIRRLADVLFVQIMRYWIETQSAGSKGWLAALRDVQIGKALQLIHQQPDLPWTVATLAGGVAMSRSAFALRFMALVGEPPMEYLTRWRMQLAAEMLKHGATVTQATQRIGYESEAAFRKAFKRELGIPPGFYQRPNHTGV
ncbi:MAG: AraC family transcriptional regulator [Roseiflexaceae bacterium]|nr:AraC family transcriptional regulator [Roseiflexaceae bacterium]